MSDFKMQQHAVKAYRMAPVEIERSESN